MNLRKNLLLNEEDGYVAVVALIMLALVAVIGVSASTTSDIEIKLAANEKFKKMTFYAADSGTELGSELVEAALEARDCPYQDSEWSGTISNCDFWSNMEEPAAGDIDIPDVGTSDVELRLWSRSQMSHSGAVQLVAGYEGMGKGTSGGGAFYDVNIRSDATGEASALSRIVSVWRHLI
jgi:Tfp pilus assembly protein PilX